MRLIYLALGFAAGLFFAAALPLHDPAAWLVLVIPTLLLTIILWDRPSSRGWLLFLIAFTLGGFRFQFVPQTSDVIQHINQGGLTIEGIITAEPDVRDDRVDLRLEAHTVERAGQITSTSGLILVQVPRFAEVQYGDRVRVTGSLSLPSTGDTFSYREFLARSGLFALMREANVEVVTTEQGSPFFQALFSLKDRARQLIARSLPEPQSALLTGIILGDARGLAPEVSDAFSAVGASHVIAISGFNMAVLSGVITALLSRTNLRPSLQALAGITVIVLYTIFVGAGAPVVRAALMSSMLLIGHNLKRKTYVPASLAFITLLLTLWNPMTLWDVGFQLSLMATLGIALFATPISRRFDSVLHRMFPAAHARIISSLLSEPLVVSLAAQVMTLPLIILYFERVSWLSLLVNLLIIPVQSYLLILGLIAVAIGLLLPALAQILFWLDMLFLGWTVGVVRAFASLPFAESAVQIDSRVIAAFYALIIGGALMVAARPTWPHRLAARVRSRPLVVALGVSLSGILILLLLMILSRPDGRLHVWMLDVGHSNAVLIQTPAGAHILVDGGRFPSRLLTALGDRLPFYDRHLEAVIITQPDLNEYAALNAVLNRYDVGLLLTNGQPNLRPEYTNLLSRVPAERQRIALSGQVLDVGDGVRIEVLYPVTTPDVTAELNDSALLIRLTYGDVSFLLTGDLSADAQSSLLRTTTWPLATVFQLPQHGAPRSLDEAFLVAAQPSVAVLQSDAANRFGHPDPDVLFMLEEIPLLRTDESGVIHFWTDGRELTAIPAR
jgi:competence protein ComEC